MHEVSILLYIELYLHFLQNHGNPTSHIPELVLNNFTTRLGHRIGRLVLISSFIYNQGSSS